MASSSGITAEVADLIRNRTLEESLPYLQVVITNTGGAVEVRQSQLAAGKGVFACRDFEADELIFKEQPLVGGQHTANKASALVCSHCFRFLGPIPAQISHCLSQLPGLGDSVDVEGLPLTDRFPLPALVPCLGRCSDARFCSQDCAQSHWDAHHCLLCTGTAHTADKAHQPQRDVQALREFREHADETNDIFHVAAQVVAGTLLAARRYLGHHGHPGRQACYEALQQAWQPWAVAWKGVWWECMACPSDVDDETGFRSEVRGLAEDSLQLLKGALYDDHFPWLFEPLVWGSILGLFDLNNLGIVVPNPLEEYFLQVHMNQDGLLSKEQHISIQRTTGPLLEALGDAYETPCEGTAFYALQSCMNHSCSPNAHAMKRDEQDVDGAAVILAKQAFKCGEEVFLSYIDESMDFAQRTELLLDYGITCQCPRCKPHRRQS